MSSVEGGATVSLTAWRWRHSRWPRVAPSMLLGLKAGRRWRWWRRQAKVLGPRSGSAEVPRPCVGGAKILPPRSGGVQALRPGTGGAEAL
jgi:hypothetical protein